MRRYMNVEIHHLNNTELLKERARHTEHMQSCIYSRHIMLWGDDMPSFPSLLLFFLSVSWVPDLGNYLLLLCKPWFSFLLARGLFLHKAFDVFQPLWPMHTSSERCKSLLPLLALAIPQYSWCLLGWDFPSAPVEEQVTDWLRHVGGSAMFATRGGEEQKLTVEIYWLWRPHDFLLNLKIPSIIFLNELCSLSLFTSILQSQRYFFCQWHQFIICHRCES